MFANAKPSELIALLATIDPASQAAGTINTGWVNHGLFGNLLAIIETGVLGTGATIDAKLQQATDAAGTGSKNVTGKAITQIVKASGDNKQALISTKSADLDTEGGFAYVRLSITVGTAASIVGAQVIGTNPRYADASAYNQAAVVQVV